jgi:hypothetical protein
MNKLSYILCIREKKSVSASIHLSCPIYCISIYRLHNRGKIPYNQTRLDECEALFKAAGERDHDRGAATSDKKL